MPPSHKQDIRSELKLTCNQCAAQGKTVLLIFTGVRTPNNRELVIRLYCPIHGYVGDWQVLQAAEIK